MTNNDWLLQLQNGHISIPGGFNIPGFKIPGQQLVIPGGGHITGGGTVDIGSLFGWITQQRLQLLQVREIQVSVIICHIKSY